MVAGCVEKEVLSLPKRRGYWKLLLDFAGFREFLIEDNHLVLRQEGCVFSFDNLLYCQFLLKVEGVDHFTGLKLELCYQILRGKEDNIWLKREYSFDL